MPQVSAREFERLPLRVHEFLHGVPLHDVWAVVILSILITANCVGTSALRLLATSA